MLPIAAEIATRMTRDLAQSALPDAPVRPDMPPREHQAPPRAQRTAVALLRRLAATSGGLADRLEGPVPTR